MASTPPFTAPTTPPIPLPPPPLEDTLCTADSQPGILGTTVIVSIDNSPPLSIRCKNTALPEMVDMATGERLLKAHKHGIVVGTKMQYLMRMNGGQKLKVPYSARHFGPATKELRSLMSRDIGSYIRSKDLMIAPSYLELPEEYRDIVSNNMKSSYDIPPTDVDKWSFVDKMTASIYKD